MDEVILLSLWSGAVLSQSRFFTDEQVGRGDAPGRRMNIIFQTQPGQFGDLSLRMVTTAGILALRLVLSTGLGGKVHSSVFKVFRLPAHPIDPPLRIILQLDLNPFGRL